MALAKAKAKAKVKSSNGLLNETRGPRQPPPIQQCMYVQYTTNLDASLSKHSSPQTQKSAIPSRFSPGHHVVEMGRVDRLAGSYGLVGGGAQLIKDCCEFVLR